MATFTNWVGNQTCNPAQILTPRSEAEVQEAVRAARHVRCVATGHSFTPIHLTDGTLLVGGSEYRTVYGGEAVHHDGAVVGRLRSASYGFTVERNLAYAYLHVQYDRGNERGRS